MFAAAYRDLVAYPDHRVHLEQMDNLYVAKVCP